MTAFGTLVEQSNTVWCVHHQGAFRVCTHRDETDPENVDNAVERVRRVVDSRDLPPELASAQFMLLVNRETGKSLGVALFETEEAMMEGDRLMNTGPGEAGRRNAVEFYEVAVQSHD